MQANGHDTTDRVSEESRECAVSRVSQSDPRFPDSCCCSASLAAATPAMSSSHEGQAPLDTVCQVGFSDRELQCD